MGEVGHPHDGGRVIPHGNRAAHQVFIEIEQLDGNIAVGQGAAQQDVVGLALIIGEGKGRVFQQFDIAIHQLTLAAAALAFFTAMHERDALAERRVQDGLAFGHFHFDAHRLEADGVGRFDH